MPGKNTNGNGKHSSHEWERYQQSHDINLRNSLIERYLPIVFYNAERLARKLPESVDFGDLVQAGVFGLIDAIDNYDLSRGVKFETYCAPRIRGAVLDELRIMDWVPRLERTRQTMINRPEERLTIQNGHAPTRSETISTASNGNASLRGKLEHICVDCIVSLDAARDGKNSSGENGENKPYSHKDLVVSKKEDPSLKATRRDLAALIQKGLTRNERLILTLYYYEEMTMKEIGATIDLSESRVSQIHKSVINRLRKRLENREEELEIS